MGATVSVKVDLKGIEKKVSSQALARGKLAIANQMILDMAPFTPAKEGNLRGSAQASGDSVRYPGPYARAQFYGSSYNKHKSFTFKRYTTPGTGKRWDKKATALHVKDWGKVGLRAMGVKA
ncbi:minor capsid protein [Streptococcus urinalis]|uniref:Minor capsid n=1 Tax=Streptococcus urinalis 2285-97 TaxID=764291 RepID=G5KEN8_9STRE|nr:minor capsid protein [Streptococcus urinalis]EHJ56387.1 minor capsid [Streptococcus urinalis 2285-97]QBX22244.1 minor capsid protein [Streptococcus phage Javan645]QBX31534.1 minor capsid protein [Streptococcus phage Javan640]VEF32938.1 phage protein [Streptococcus urinalis]